MNVKLLTEHHLEFLGFAGGCTGSYESVHVKIAILLEITCRGSILLPCFLLSLQHIECREDVKF